MTEPLLVAVGQAAHATGAVVLPLGPHHPSTHGVLQVALTVTDGVVVTAEPRVGFLHRGAEKLFEVRDYRQLTMLANRHDWLSAFASELGICLAVERMLGMTVPDRAVWLRTLLAELNRVLSGLAFLGALDPAGQRGFAEREALQAVMEAATGGRMHYMWNRVGGLAADVPAGWTSSVAAALDDVSAVLPALAALVDEQPRGAGVLAQDVAVVHGCSGPVGRGSGVDLDVRRDDPYLAYGSLDVPVHVETAGDARARQRCLLAGVEGAVGLARTCLSSLPSGPVALRLPKTVKAPEGSTYAWTENPLGAQGYWLVSRGGPTPWRLAMRTASFNNVSALGAALPGTRVADLAAVLASFCFVIGDVDK
jgi:NADH-quinone oxidoreductase subunit D